MDGTCVRLFIVRRRKEYHNLNYYERDTQSSINSFSLVKNSHRPLFVTATNGIHAPIIRRTDALEAFVRGTRSIALYKKDKKALIEMSSGTPKNVPAST